jgi:hypothetical protein
LITRKRKKKRGEYPFNSYSFPQHPFFHSRQTYPSAQGSINTGNHKKDREYNPTEGCIVNV